MLGSSCIWRGDSGVWTNTLSARGNDNVFANMLGPNCLTHAEFNRIRNEVGLGQVVFNRGGSSHALPLQEWFEQVTIDRSPSDRFKEILVHYSAANVSGTELNVLKLGSFCELRAGLAATEVAAVKKVMLSPQNSPADRNGIDLHVTTHHGAVVPVQIKACKGKESRVPPGVALIQDVSVLDRQTLLSKLRDVIQKHIMQLQE